MVSEAAKTVAFCTLWGGATGSLAAGLRADRDGFLWLAVATLVLCILGVAEDLVSPGWRAGTGEVPMAFPKVRLVLPERLLGRVGAMPRREGVRLPDRISAVPSTQLFPMVVMRPDLLDRPVLPNR